MSAQRQMAVQGRVAQLRSYPVKSMDAVGQPSAEVTIHGLAGDRTWAVVGADGRIVSARQVAALLDVRAAIGPAGPRLHLPDREDVVEGAGADAALSAYVGRAVHLERVQERAHQVAPVHLVSLQAIAGASGPGCADAPGDLDRPRANVFVDLGDLARQCGPGLERDLIGRELELGDVVLRLTTAPQHCLGVYADVVAPGALRVDDPVRVREPREPREDKGQTSATGLSSRG